MVFKSLQRFPKTFFGEEITIQRPYPILSPLFSFSKKVSGNLCNDLETISYFVPFYFKCKKKKFFAAFVTIWRPYPILSPLFFSPKKFLVTSVRIQRPYPISSPLFLSKKVFGNLCNDLETISYFVPSFFISEKKFLVTSVTI